MTKCRSNVHTQVHAKWSSDTPTMSTQQAAPVDIAPHLTQRARNVILAVFSTTSVFNVLQEIMTETVFWGRQGNEACGRSKKRSIMGPKLSKTGPKINKTGPKLSRTGPKINKTGPKLSKTSVKQVLNQSNGRVNPLHPTILSLRSRMSLFHVCSYTPRFSYVSLKLPYVRCRRHLSSRVPAGYRCRPARAGP